MWCRRGGLCGGLAVGREGEVLGGGQSVDFFPPPHASGSFMFLGKWGVFGEFERKEKVLLGFLRQWVQNPASEHLAWAFQKKSSRGVALKSTLLHTGFDP